MVRVTPHTLLCFLTASSVWLVGCSIYESSGHKAIAENQGGILTAGLNTRLQYYYECRRENDVPGFLKDPMEVIETEFESQNISILAHPTADAPWVVAYHHLPNTNLYTYCKVFSLYTKQVRTHKDAAALGIEKLLPLL